MGQRDIPDSGVPDVEKTPPRRANRPSLRQALNALMMSDERRKDGQPGEITLGMEIDFPRDDKSKPIHTNDRNQGPSAKTGEGVRKMSANANSGDVHDVQDIRQVSSGEQMRIGKRGGTPAGGAPITLEAEPMVAGAAGPGGAGKKTQMVRGQQEIERSGFHQEPVVGWLVVIGGPGLGAYRPVFEGNNTLGRAKSQRIPIDFGDESISAEEQVYIRYDSSDKSFLLVPNLTKTNVVAVNDEKPTNAVSLQAMDVITIGRTQLVFVPFCGAEFDWTELKKIQK